MKVDTLIGPIEVEGKLGIGSEVRIGDIVLRIRGPEGPFEILRWESYMGPSWGHVYPNEYYIVRRAPVPPELVRFEWRISDTQVAVVEGPKGDIPPRSKYAVFSDGGFAVIASLSDEIPQCETSGERFFCFPSGTWRISNIRKRYTERKENMAQILYGVRGKGEVKLVKGEEGTLERAVEAVMLRLGSGERFVVYECFMCGYECGYISEGGNLFYDSGCHCAPGPNEIVPATKAEVRETLAMNPRVLEQIIGGKDYGTADWTLKP